MFYKKNRIIVAILALSFVKMSMGAVTPALACIAEAFPDTSATSVAALATLPTLSGIPCSLVSGRIVGRYIKYKTVAMFGLTILFISGIMPYFAQNMSELLVWRGIMGIGLGAINPLAPSITMNTLSYQAAEKQIGWNSFSSNLGAIVFQFVGGMASDYSWRLGFISYALVIPVWIIVFRNIDEPRIEREKNYKKAEISTKMKKSLAFWCLLGVVFSLLFYTVISDLSGVITNNGYGSSGESGLVFSVLSIGGVLGSYLLKVFVTKMGKLVFAVGGTICAVGFTILAVGQSLTMMFIGAGVFGVGFGLFLPAVTLFGGMVVTPESRPFAVSCIVAANALAGFLSAYAFSALRNIFSVTSDRFSIGLSAIVFAIIGIIFLISNRRLIKRNKT